MKKAVAALFVIALVWTRVAHAQSVYPDRPMQLRITGTLLPAETEKREDLILVDVFVQDTPWILRIGKVEELNPSGRGDTVKEDLLLRQVRFYGASELLAQLQEGKVLTITGELDQKVRRFRVSAVHEGGATVPSSHK
ncbi:MAG: hypothetical protein AB7G75_08280 [Candidatus Binatia bacterium]